MASYRWLDPRPAAADAIKKRRLWLQSSIRINASRIRSEREAQTEQHVDGEMIFDPTLTARHLTASAPSAIETPRLSAVGAEWRDGVPRAAAIASVLPQAHPSKDPSQ